MYFSAPLIQIAWTSFCKVASSVISKALECHYREHSELPLRQLLEEGSEFLCHSWKEVRSCTSQCVLGSSRLRFCCRKFRAGTSIGSADDRF